MDTPNRLNDHDVERLFEQMNAVIKGSHFVYTSGLHGPNYVKKDLLGLDPELTDMFAYELAWRLRQNQVRDQVVAVVGAPMGAIRLSDRVCYWLNHIYGRADGIKFWSIYADKVADGTLVIKRGFPKIFEEGHGKQVFCVEDILNTGKSGKALVDAVRAVGGEPIALGALCNRGGVTAESLGVEKLASLMNVNFETFPPDALPESLAKIPVRTDLGHGQAYLDSLKKSHANF